MTSQILWRHKHENKQKWSRNNFIFDLNMHISTISLILKVGDHYYSHAVKWIVHLVSWSVKNRVTRRRPSKAGTRRHRDSIFHRPLNTMYYSLSRNVKFGSENSFQHSQNSKTLYFCVSPPPMDLYLWRKRGVLAWMGCNVTQMILLYGSS